jgi:hypothetical protein
LVYLTILTTLKPFNMLNFGYWGGHIFTLYYLIIFFSLVLMPLIIVIGIFEFKKVTLAFSLTIPLIILSTSFQ